jgi:hypothetical protein
MTIFILRFKKKNLLEVTARPKFYAETKYRLLEAAPTLRKIGLKISFSRSGERRI